MSDKKKQTAKKSKNVGKIKWEKLEKEYISTKISYRDLAKKHKISDRQVMRYGSEHNWVEKRRQFVGKVSAEVEKSLIQTETVKTIADLQAISDAAEVLMYEVLNACSDPEQLYKRSFYDCEKGEAVEYRTSKIDGNSLNQLVRALHGLTDIVRDVRGIDRTEKDRRVTVEFTTKEALEKYGN